MFSNKNIGLKCVYVFRLWLIVSVTLKSTDAFLLGKELPCDYYDSINITDGVHHINKSITFNGIEFTSVQYSEVNYVLVNGTKPIKAWEYIRGCLCKIRPCIRLCCDGTNIENGIKYRTNEAAKLIKNEINQTDVVNLVDSFAYINRVCNQHSVVEDFKIHGQGYISDKFGVTKDNNYCLNVTITEDKKPKLMGMMCSDQPEAFPIRTVKMYMMFLSSVFLILKIIVYISLPELRNFNGKCFICFSISLAVAFISYPWMRLSEWNYIPPLVYEIVSWVMHVSVLSACLWLNVMCFDSWLTFRVTKRTRKFSEGMEFFLYTIYAYGLPILLTIITAAITNSFGSMAGYYMNVKLQFGTTKEKYRLTQIFIYYLPLGIIFIINIALFILTALNIYRARKNVKEILSQHRVQQVQETYSDSFLLYLRMFVSVGIMGSVEPLKPVLHQYHDQFFVYTDIIIGAHGIFIFILFVLRPRVLKLVKKKLMKVENRETIQLRTLCYLRAHERNY